MTSTLGKLIALVPLVLGLPAAAAESVSQLTTAPEACAKTVGALGALMSHKAETAPDGRPVYRYVLRANGLDYDAVCDAETGVVGDVTLRPSH